MEVGRIPPMIVCPRCGPESVCYAGRVLYVPCAVCRGELEAARGPLFQTLGTSRVL